MKRFQESPLFDPLDPISWFRPATTAMCAGIKYGCTITSNLLRIEAESSINGQRFSAAQVRLWHSPCQRTPLGCNPVSHVSAFWLTGLGLGTPSRYLARIICWNACKLLWLGRLQKLCMWSCICKMGWSLLGCQVCRPPGCYLCTSVFLSCNASHYTCQTQDSYCLLASQWSG